MEKDSQKKFLVGVVDYGLGNVRAILNIYSRLGIQAIALHSADQVKQCDKLILPGVGAFDWAVSRLEQSGLRETLERTVLEDEVAVLGICVGMQMLADSSEEGKQEGLGWIPGVVRKFELSDLPLPHMGWNSAKPVKRDGIFSESESEVDFYFLHSYFFEASDDEHVLSVTSYGGTFASAVRKDHIFGVQFHPEKSHQAGIMLLKNFAEGAFC